MSTKSKLLEKPSLILASPWDLGYLREKTLKLHADLLGEPPPPNHVAMYAWEKQTKEELFDDRLGAKEQIPSPMDPQCEGVIAMFGEWIGRELPADNDVDHLSVLNATAENLRYRLQFPWIEGAEESGCFPLTGSTYEVLTAITAYKLLQQGKREIAPPLLLFIGSEQIGEEYDGTEGDWGNRKLRSYVNIHLEDKRKEKDLRLDIIDLHLKQLKNLYLFMEICLGHVSKMVAGEQQAELKIAQFLEKILGQKPENHIFV